MKSVAETVYPVINEKEDLSFLRRLDRRLHFLGHNNADLFYHEESMSVEETDRAIKITDREDVIIYPIVVREQLGFQISRVNPSVGFYNVEPMLTVLEDQLPEKRRWEYLRHVFMHPSNTSLIALCGINLPTEERERYALAA